jgi:hypothetical protein
MTGFNDLREFKNELKMLLGSDNWATCLDAQFECAAHLWWKSVAVPYEWEYSPGAVSDPREPDNYFYELFDLTEPDILIEIGNFLNRYCEIMRKAGMNY